MTDGQLGRIGGLYFALFYCVLAIPVGWLADRTNRVKVLSFACALWSAATIACGMASTLSAAGDRAHVGGRGRGGRRAAVVRHHLRLLSAGHAWHRARVVQHGATHWPVVGRGLRCVDRGGLRLAFGIHFDRRRRHRHRARRAAVRTGAEARRSRRAARAPRGTRCEGALLAHLPHVLRRSGAAAPVHRHRRYTNRHLRHHELHHAVADAREGHDAARGRGLLRVADRRGAQRGHVHLRKAHRPVRAAQPGRLRLSTCRRRWRWRSRSSSASCGRRAGRWRWSFSPSRCSSTASTSRPR